VAAGSTFLLAGLVPANATPVLAAGTIPLTGDQYTQDFNSLSDVADSTTNTISIPGWNLSESGDGARDNEQYAVDTGASTTGDTYSYGPADSVDRAFGGLGDDALIPMIGASFTNATGSTITSVDIGYTGEQWHLGAADRTDRLDFQISTSATSLTTGTWTDVDSLDFASPSTSSPIGQRDGNDAVNQRSVSSSIGGLSIPDGATFWIRWTAFDAAGPDDGLAVDDFALTPTVDSAPAVATTDPTDGATGFAPGGPLSVTFDEPVSVDGEWSAIECATSGAHAATVSGGPDSFVLDPTTDFVAGEECTVTVVAARVTDQDNDDPPDSPTADHVFRFTIEDAAPAEPPVANNDTATTHEDTPIGIRVTANDTDVDGDLLPASVRIVVPPGTGNATVTADGTVSYTPDPNFHGRDHFTYRVCDAAGRCDRATVTVSVTAVNDPPTADDIDVTTAEDHPVVIDVTGHAADPDGDIATVNVATPPTHGHTTEVDGSIRYTPDPNFHGRDHFTYRVCDATADCVTATVTLTIRPVNDAPVARPDVVTIVWAGPVWIDVLGNDTDVDGSADLDSTSVTIVAGPWLGVARVNATTGAIEYTASPGTVGTDRLTYRVCDLGGRCATATLDIRLDVPPTPTTTPPPPPGTLPPTGSNLGTHAGVAALAAVAAGALLLAASRRMSWAKSSSGTGTGL
jgi:hypothetical protein